MTYQPRSGARQLPLLGPAIVGAVMLVRSDTVDRPEPEFDDSTMADLSRFSVVLDLPQPQLGELPRARFAPVAKLKSVAAGQAQPAQSPDADAAEESSFTTLSLPMPQPLSVLAVSDPVVGVSQIASLPAPAL